MTSFSTAALVLLALGVVAIWPENRPGPAPARAVAQNQGDGGGQPAVAGGEGKPGKQAGSPAAANTGEGTLSDKLSQRLTAEFVETPLKDVLAFLADTGNVQIFLNRKAIENEGLTLDSPITISLKNIRLDMLLDLVLEQASDSGLTYVERDGILIVSTMANLEGASEVRVYNCRDLLSMESPANGGKAMPGMPAAGPASFGPGGLPGEPAVGPPARAAGMPGGGMGGMGGAMGEGMGGFGGGPGGGGMVHLTEAQQRAESLKQLIQTAVKPSSWSEVGGIGTISEYNGLIVINHDAKTHKQVENVLKMLREAAGLEQGKTAKAAKQ